MSITYKRMQIFKFFAMLLLITHWLSCLWAFSLVFADGDDTPRWIDAVEALEENVAVKTRDSVWKLYAASLYFTSYTITSVGYGDIGPQNIVERSVCIVLIVIAGVSWAYVLGQVCGIIGSMDKHEQEFRNLMDELNTMMVDQGLPRLMCRRIRFFFLCARDAQKNN